MFVLMESGRLEVARLVHKTLWRVWDNALHQDHSIPKKSSRGFHRLRSSFPSPPLPPVKCSGFGWGVSRVRMNPGQVIHQFSAPLMPCSPKTQELLPKVGLEDRGNVHAAVRLKVVFQDRREDPWHREPGTVDRVHQLRPSALLGTKTDLRTPRLEGLEIRAARDLKPPLLPRRPDFKIIFLRLGKAEIAATHEQHVIRQFQLLQETFRMGSQALQLFVAPRRDAPISAARPCQTDGGG